VQVIWTLKWETTLNYEFEAMCEEAVVGYFKIMSQHLPRRAEENDDNLASGR